VELDDPELYGLLRPRPGAPLTARVASRDVALLFLTLASPAPLPAYVAATEPDGRVAARLVLDGVLEVATQHGWRSGPGALGDDDGSSVVEGRLAQLAVLGLRCAQALDGVDADAIAMRLYRYGRRPVSPAWRRRLGDEAAVARFCGLDDEGVAARALRTRFAEASARPFWRLWLARGRPRRDAGRTHKLYVSPDAEALDGALAVAAQALPEATALKVGRGLEGILRPDKIVAYFAGLDDLQAGAARLRERLDGCPAHGVPFTAPITSDGLLSWGVDPPAGATGSESWRLWLAQRLADELVAARHSGSEPWRAALARLRLDGVDTATWVPEARLFAATG